jgi:hypothetical protein
MPNEPKERQAETTSPASYWERLTPEQNARICAGLRQGFEAHYTNGPIR